jgi:murein L,D-transpeptidase YafK
MAKLKKRKRNKNKEDVYIFEVVNENVEEKSFTRDQIKLKIARLEAELEIYSKKQAELDKYKEMLALTSE